MARSIRIADPPPGFRYLQEFVSPEEEEALVEGARGLDFRAPVLHGTPARRETAHFGWLYGYGGGGLEPGPELPGFLAPLRARAAALAGLPEASLAEALVTRYPPGAGIGWHRDAPQFGSLVVGVSLASACRMRFRRERADAWEVFERELQPRSAYVLGGAARWGWQHHLPPCPALRYSVTFRTLPEARAEAPAPP